MNHMDKEAVNELATANQLIRRRFLVYRNLSANGIPDLIAYSPSGEVIRVEVRARASNSEFGFFPKSALEEENIDLYAVVCWAGRVRFIPPPERIKG
jgi:hypothetical protein